MTDVSRSIFMAYFKRISPWSKLINITREISSDEKNTSRLSTDTALVRHILGPDNQCTAHLGHMHSHSVHVDEQRGNLVIVMGSAVRIDDLNLVPTHRIRKRAEENVEESGEDKEAQSIAQKLLDLYRRCSDPAAILSEILGSWSIFIYSKDKGQCLAARASDGVEDLLFAVDENGGVTFSNSLDYFNTELEIQSLKPGHYLIGGSSKKIRIQQFALTPDELDKRMKKDESHDFSSDSEEEEFMGGSKPSTPTNLKSGSGPIGMLRSLSIKLGQGFQKLSLSPSDK